MGSPAGAGRGLSPLPSNDVVLRKRNIADVVGPVDSVDSRVSSLAGGRVVDLDSVRTTMLTAREVGDGSR